PPGSRPTDGRHRPRHYRLRILITVRIELGAAEMLGNGSGGTRPPGMVPESDLLAVPASRSQRGGGSGWMKSLLASSVRRRAKGAVLGGGETARASSGGDMTRALRREREERGLKRELERSEEMREI